MRLAIPILLLLTGIATADPAGPDRLPMRLSASVGGESATALELAASFPGTASGFIVSPTSSWFNLHALEGNIFIPASGPTNIQALVFFKDWDYLWYQQLQPDTLKPGAPNPFHVDLDPTSTA